MSRSVEERQLHKFGKNYWGTLFLCKLTHIRSKAKQSKELKKEGKCNLPVKTWHVEHPEYP